MRRTIVAAHRFQHPIAFRRRGPLARLTVRMRRIAALVLTGALVLSACTSTEVPQPAQTTAPPTPTPKPPRLPVKGVALPVVVAKAGRPVLESAWMNPPLESYSQPFTDHLLNALRRATEFMAG